MASSTERIIRTDRIISMPYFKKRPLQFEARHYTGANGHDIAAWIGLGRVIVGADGLLYLDGNGGTVTAETGDWIIREGDDFEVCPKARFEALYAEVEEVEA
jgi:hypothetical protein